MAKAVTKEWCIIPTTKIFPLSPWKIFSKANSKKVNRAPIQPPSIVLSELRHFSTSHVFQHKNRMCWDKLWTFQTPIPKNEKEYTWSRKSQHEMWKYVSVEKTVEDGDISPPLSTDLQFSFLLHWSSLGDTYTFSQDSVLSEVIFGTNKVSHISLLGNFLIVPLFPFVYVSDLAFVFVFLFVPTLVILPALSVYFNNIRQRVPYFNVLRQKRVF